MHISTQVSGDTVKVKLQGQFTFDSHKDFRRVTKEQIAVQGKTIEIDFADVDYLDSSALGMLLLVREQAAVAGKTVALANCRGAVKGVLDIANFQRLFTIS